MGAGKSAVDFVQAHGRKVGEIMTQDSLFTATEDMPLEKLVRLMQREDVKRLPVLRGDALVGIVTRARSPACRRKPRSRRSGSNRR